MANGWPDEDRPNGWMSPISIYEVHLGSWRRVLAEGNRSLTYRELAIELAEHVKRLGFTHVEFLPVMEHPFFGSWGYQVTGYFAPTSRFGTPQDFKFLIDHLHQQGIGVILDWVPSHFPNDEHGLAYFDGTHLFEHADPRQGLHPDWKSCIFNYGRNEVRSFLQSNALFWLRGIPRRRPASGRGGVDAVPGLFPRTKANGSPTITAAGEPGSDRLSPHLQYRGLFSTSRRRHRSPRNRRTGRWCRGRPTRAGWDSA